LLLPFPRYGVPRCVRRADERRSWCRVLRSLLVGSVLFRILSDRGLATQRRAISVGTRLDRSNERASLGLVAVSCVRGSCDSRTPIYGRWNLRARPAQKSFSGSTTKNDRALPNAGRRDRSRTLVESRSCIQARWSR
jgi:hypothetical protein